MQKVSSAAPAVNAIVANGVYAQQSRNMATLKSIQIRLKSVKNIQKITQSMKMVSAAKYVSSAEWFSNIFFSFGRFGNYNKNNNFWIFFVRYARAERDLKQARPFGEGAKRFYEVADVKVPTENPKELLVAITSDRGKMWMQDHFVFSTGNYPTFSHTNQFLFVWFQLGLCGAVHTGVARTIRNDLQSRDTTENAKIVCVGDKSRAILQRLFADKFVFVANEIGRQPPTFLDAAEVAKNILTSGYDFSHGHLVSNFISNNCFILVLVFQNYFS